MDIKARLSEARQQLDQYFLLRWSNLYLQIRSQKRLGAFKPSCDKLNLSFREAIENFVNAIDQLRASDHCIMKLTRKRRALRIGKMRFLRR